MRRRWDTDLTNSLTHIKDNIVFFKDQFDDSDVHELQTFLHNNSCGENQVYDESSNLLQMTSELSAIPEEDTDVFTLTW